MFSFERIAERRIKEAIQKGEFDNLEGKGKPLKYEDDSHIPPDLRMAYKILKNAGFLPPELMAEKEVHDAIDLLAAMKDERKRYKQIKKLNIMITKMNMMRQRPVNFEKNQVYFHKIVEKVRLEKE